MTGRSICIFICMIMLLNGNIMAQSFESRFSVDTRAGYSTNALLFPFLGEWDRVEPAGYALFSPSGTLFYDSGSFSGSATLGGVLQGFTEERHESLFGGFAAVTLNRRLSSRWFAGLESGVSGITGRYDRTIGWVQPLIGWQPGLFSRLTLRAGPTFRGYHNLTGELEQSRESSSRFDLYALEYQNWIGFRWLLRAGVHGDLGDPSGTVSLGGSAEHLPTDRLRLGLRAGVDRYTYQLTQDGGGTGGGPVGGGPPVASLNPAGSTVEESDRIWRFGLTASWQPARRVELFASADQLLLSEVSGGDSIHDLHTALGVRVTLQPGTRRGMRVDAEWERNREQTVSIRTGYRGEGRLYLLGDFNDWSEPGIPLTRQSAGRYAARLPIGPGAWEYKILLVEGEERHWLDFGEETYTVPDGFGGENGIIFIQ